MSLPRAIEYLLTIREEGGNAVLQGLNQSVTVLPPLTRITIQTEPALQNYAEIGYKLCFDSQMVPSAIYAEGTYFSNRPYGGLLTQYNLDNPIDTFVVTTHQQKATIVIENMTNLNQYYAAIAFILVVPTQNDWERVTKALKHMEFPDALDLLGKMKEAVR